MKLLTHEIRAALEANARATQQARAEDRREPDHEPVARFFNPVGAATWLVTEIDEDDIMFGLADLGFGSPLKLGFPGEVGGRHRQFPRAGHADHVDRVLGHAVDLDAAVS